MKPEKNPFIDGPVVEGQNLIPDDQGNKRFDDALERVRKSVKYIKSVTTD